MKKLENRIKRIEELISKESAPVTFKLIFYGAGELMPPEQWSCGNVTFEPVLYDDLQPVTYRSCER